MNTTQDMDVQKFIIKTSTILQKWKRVQIIYDNRRDNHNAIIYIHTTLLQIYLE